MPHSYLVRWYDLRRWYLLFLAALEEDGHAQYRSRHKKVDLTAVVTTLLVQLDCAVTTTHQCLTKDLLDKDTT